MVATEEGAVVVEAAGEAATVGAEVAAADTGATARQRTRQIGSLIALPSLGIGRP